MDDKKFSYVYTAPTEEERKEIESIQKRYAPQEKREETPLQRLRSIDKKGRRLANCIGLSFGIVGCLIFGLGLTMVLEWGLWLYGVSVATAGGALMAIAYPSYKRSIKGWKRKHGEEILKLSKSLLGQ